MPDTPTPTPTDPSSPDPTPTPEPAPAPDEPTSDPADPDGPDLVGDAAANDNGGPAWADELRRQSYGGVAPEPDPAPARRKK